MISKELVKKASNMDVKLFEEGKDNLYFLVGYMVRYNKRFKNLVCNCESDAMWGNNMCSHRVAVVLKAKEIPTEIKDCLYED
jgi:hypothetical protein